MRLVITVKTQAKLPSKSTFLPVSPPFANKVKNEIKKQGPNTKGCPKLYNSQNSWVGTTTSSNSQEGFSGFWQTRDEKRSSKNNKRTVAAVGDRRCNDVSGFPNRPPHPRQSLPWCWGDIGNFHVRGLYVDGMIGISPAHCQIANFSMRYEFIKFRTYYC